MFRTCSLAVLIIALCSTTFAGDLADKIKADIKAKIASKAAQKVDASGKREIKNSNLIVGGDNVAYNSADGSQNLTLKYREGDVTYVEGDKTLTYAPVTTTTTTITDSRRSREGDVTYAPRYKEGNVTYAPRTTAVPHYAAPYVPVTQYVPTPSPKLSYHKVDEDCVVEIAIRCWGQCGRYFIDAEGRTWKLLATASTVPLGSRHGRLTGKYWRGHDGLLYFTAIWPCGTTRTFIDP